MDKYTLCLLGMTSKEISDAKSHLFRASLILEKINAGTFKNTINDISRVMKDLSKCINLLDDYVSEQQFGQQTNKREGD